MSPSTSNVGSLKWGSGLELSLFLMERWSHPGMNYAEPFS